MTDFVMKRLVVFVVLLGGTLAASSWAGQKSDTSAASTPDDRIVDQVRVRLAGDPDIRGGSLDVDSKDGVVVIKGRVDTEKDKAKATKVAKKVKGVKSVDNELSVGPPA
jgi:osmotically-inducible protein OsmY